MPWNEVAITGKDAAKPCEPESANWNGKSSNSVVKTEPAAAPTSLATAQGPFVTPVAYHKYCLEEVDLFLHFVCQGAIGLRAASRILQIVLSFWNVTLPAPAYQTGRMWLMRVGYYELHRPKEQADDWVWIIDHTVQLGPDKCLVILGVRLSQLARRDDWTLQAEDMSLLQLLPMEQSNGDLMDEQLEETVAQTGAPRQILRDEGSDLSKGCEQFTERHPETDVTYDITHKTARLLKRHLEADPCWGPFKQAANQVRLKLQQTRLAYLLPPTQRSKSRYMSVAPLIAWIPKMLRVLREGPSPELLDGWKAEDYDAEKVEAALGWLRAYEEPARTWQEWVEVSQVTEAHVRRRGHYRGSARDLEAEFEKRELTEASASLRQELLEFVEEESTKPRAGERLLGTSDVLESLFGKYKHLEDTQAKGGFTGLILSLGALVGRQSAAWVQQALESTPTKKVTAWVKSKLGATLSSKRRKIFASADSNGTKMGSRTAAPG